MASYAKDSGMCLRRKIFKRHSSGVALAFTAYVALTIFASCATTTKRVDADKVVDIDGFWNDSDVRLVCEDLINQCVSSPRVAKFSAAEGRVPTVVLGTIKNESAEHIDTSIVAKRFQNAIINSGVMDFVASSGERGELFEEAAWQEEHALDYSADEDGEEISKLDKSNAADFMLMGSVKSIVQSEDNTTVRTYFVYAQMMDVKLHTIVWSGENSEIKKIIKRQKHKL